MRIKKMSAGNTPIETSTSSKASPTPLEQRSLNRAAHQIIDIIERRRPKLVSFDVFDTIVCRTVRKPTDIFSIIAKRLNDSGLLNINIHPHSFASYRIAAETAARETNTRLGLYPETTIEQIYERILLINEADRAKAVQTEIDVERDHLLLDPTISLVLEFLQLKSIDFCFVSNTYLSAAQLTQLLEGVLNRKIDVSKIYSSSEIGVPKEHGLIGFMLAEANLSPADVLHIGDNFSADIDGAKLVGIDAIHFGQLHSIASEITTGEHNTAGLLGVRRDFEPPGYIDNIRKHILHSRFGLDHVLKCEELVGLGTVGPVLAAFVEWLTVQAQALNITKLLCMTREGIMLAELINLYSRKMNMKVEAHPFLSSRTVTYPTVFEFGTIDEFRTYIFSRRTPLTAASFLRRLRRADLIHEVQREYHHIPIHRHGVTSELILESLAASEEIRKAAIEWSDYHQRRLETYVDRLAKQIELSNDERIAFVDLGWTTRSQRVLESALAKIGRRNPSIGLYLATDENAPQEAALGTISLGFLFENGMPSVLCGPVLRCKEILEQVCSAQVGSVIGYGADGSVKFGAGPKESVQSNFLENVRESVRYFVDQYCNHKLSGFPISLADEVDSLRIVLARLTIEPTEQEARVIGAWIHDENNGSDSSECIIDDYFVEIARYATPQQINNLQGYWMFGLIGLHRPELKSNLVGICRGLESAGAPEWNAARFHVRGVGGEINDYQGDYFVYHGRAVSYVTLFTSSQIELSWHNFGRKSGVTIDQILIAYRDCGSGEVQRRRVTAPSLLIKGEVQKLGSSDGVFVSPNDSVTIAIEVPKDRPLEVSVVLCLRKEG